MFSIDFYEPQLRTKKDSVVLYPDFKIRRSNDLLVKGKSFYAIWDKKKGLWSTNECDVQRLVDEELRAEAKKIPNAQVAYLESFGSKSWTEYKNYISKMFDSDVTLDCKIAFANTKVEKEDYISKCLPYPLQEGSIDAYDTIMRTLYEPREREKLEWSIGAIISGDARSLQKFVVLYGDAGTGKSTVLNIIQQLFDGYYTIFDAKSLTTSSSVFATEMLRNNPLVAIQHDGDLSRIEDNTRLNSIVSHEEIIVNEKYKSGYILRPICFLYMATNKPVKITDAKSGLIRRLIDVHPSGDKIPAEKFQALKSKIKYELGGIAFHCLKVYERLGKHYYDSYKPLDMIFQTDVFFNFVEDNYLYFEEENGITLGKAYSMYKEYCDETLVDFKLPRYKFREELKNYFENFMDVTRVDGKQVRSYYSGFKKDRFRSNERLVREELEQIELNCTESIFDKLYSECLAQEAVDDRPKYKWSNVKTKLKDLDTHQVHYIQLPENHIVIDFDLKDENGEKSLELNLKEASKFPSTYTELSKSGKGVHLHYIYMGDTAMLSYLYSDDIEIKVFNGNSALRRKLSKCNDIPIATISGLPLKGEKKMINFEGLANEKAIRTTIEKNLRKEIHPGTKPSIDFIFKILEDAYNSGIGYDVTDMRSKILKFANNSTNQAEYCVKMVSKMKFKSEEANAPSEAEAPIVFFDVEVFPNLFLVNWKYEGENNKCVRMINPTPEEIKKLCRYNLIGFNCRRYDNHILYARMQGYSNKELFNLSQRIVNGGSGNTGLFGEAYNISYTDVYDFASAGNKKSLKKFEIELGIHHQELGLPWDEPVPEDKWVKVAEYCDNDVIATEAVFNHLKGDWTARKILAELSGLSVNDTTNQHSIKIIFGDEKNPQKDFVYTDLSTIFPGYKFENGVSSYRGENPGEGGYVYSEPGMYENVALLDVASMHPTSIEQLNLFGPYTQRFSDIKKARVAIKHGDMKELMHILDGRLVPYLGDAGSMKDLSNALKTVINSVYGLTSAKFDNKCRDPRNVDNIVAKRGALFMIDLKHAVQEQGYSVAHIKTDSIKIPNADEKIINFIMEFGKKYGYIFEHEDTYKKMCLVNDAVYICKNGKGEWSATGAQFAQPYVFKTLFSHEPIEFDDKCEIRNVSSALYLDMNEDMPEDVHNYVFVGKTSRFCPIKDGRGGGLLVREKDGKYYAVNNSKGYRWLESEQVKLQGREDEIDLGYYIELCNNAIADISKYGDFAWFTKEDE